MKSQDAYFDYENNQFAIGTALVRKELTLTDDGHFYMSSCRHNPDVCEYVRPALAKCDEFQIVVDEQMHCGLNGGWRLQNTSCEVMSQGELHAAIILENNQLQVERHYVAYPDTAVIQQWTQYKNISTQPILVSKPSLFIKRILGGYPSEVDFGYMTGGANFTGSCMFKTLPLVSGFAKDFDSQYNPEITEIDGHCRNVWHSRLGGTGIWYEFFAFIDRTNNNGMYINFDYQGCWKAEITCRDGNTSLTAWCDLNNYRMEAGEKLLIAPMMFGMYSGDVDDMGNSINDYIYKYKWDYTRDRYFNRTSLCIWRSAPLKDKVITLVDAARYIGIERIIVDDFWYDAKGNWNGIFGDDWPQIIKYVKEHDMLFRLWMPPWHADRLSDVWVEHPDWMLDFYGNWYNWTIDMSIEEAYQWVLDMLCRKQQEFGEYELRVDGDPCNLRNDGSMDTMDGDWNITHKQSENFYRLYKEFKDCNPEAGLNGCSSGGHTLTIESVRYTDQQQITDGQCYHIGGYWTTLIMPIDKHQGLSMSRSWFADWQQYNPACQNLFSAPLSAMQNPQLGYSMDALEGKRKEYELFYWLRDQGVYGRHIKVYRPEVQYGDKTFVLQRMTQDNIKGIVMVSPNILNPILNKPAIIFPKGLIKDESYLIESLLGSMAVETRMGAQWMRDGINVNEMKPGDYLMINLPNRPGSGLDRDPPTTPAWATKDACTWMDVEGVALKWGCATDNVRVSYYEIYCNGIYVTKVSFGQYYFDTEGTMDNEYSICAVDADGNNSQFVIAHKA